MCLCVTGEESACGSHMKSVCQALCQCCVEDAVCSSGLGTFCIHPLLCVFVFVHVTVRVVHCLKHLLDDLSSKWVSLCACVCLFTHLMDYTIKKLGELANIEVAQ